MSRPFAYNPSGVTVSGTIQVGSVSVGYPTSGFGGTQWWNGPDEGTGYVIAIPTPLDNQDTPVPEDSLYLDPAHKATDISLSNSDQTAHQIFSYQQSVLGLTLISGTDKVMFSVRFTSSNPPVGVGSRAIGVGKHSMNYQGNPFGGYPGNDSKSIGFSDDGKYYYNGTVQDTGLPTWTSGDIIDITISHGQYWWIRVNGGYWNNSNTANPTTPSGGLTMSGLSDYYPTLCPTIYGTMEILNYPKYGYPSGYNFLGHKTSSIGFLRSSALTDGSFISLANYVSARYNSGPTFSAALSAKTWLNTNGYWTSYITPILSLDAANYTSGDWVDSIGGKQFTLYNSPGWSSSNGGYFNFNAASAQYAESTSLPSLSNWTVGVWHYYDGTNVGGAPCIITENYIGGNINYSIGNNNGGFSSGFFNGGWRVTDGYSLTSGNWYYIVGTYDGTTINLYVNNTLVDSTNYTGSLASSGAGIRLMRRWDLGDYWGGKLATVDIYDQALNSTQVSSIWNLTKSRFGL